MNVSMKISIIKGIERSDNKFDNHYDVKSYISSKNNDEGSDIDSSRRNNSDDSDGDNNYMGSSANELL